MVLSAGTLFAPRRRGWWLLALLVFMPIAGGVLLIGGVFGLAYVATGDWGGLMLNVVLTFVAVVGSLPLGILLAFGAAVGAAAWCAGAPSASSNCGAARRCSPCCSWA